MGCTHSRNSKSKAAKTKDEQPLERRSTLHPLSHNNTNNNRVAHFDESSHTTDSTSNESMDPVPQQHSKNLLNETMEEEKQSEKKETVMKPQKELIREAEKLDSAPQTAIPPTIAQQKQFVSSTYYPMPTVGEKQTSPEKKKTRKKTSPPIVEQYVLEEKKVKREHQREKPAMVLGPNYRPHLTPEDLECIKRSVQQRNERRAYMMTHRNETDDTLYELEMRMPEKDYTNRLEGATLRG